MTNRGRRRLERCASAVVLCAAGLGWTSEAFAEKPPALISIFTDERKPKLQFQLVDPTGTLTYVEGSGSDPYFVRIAGAQIELFHIRAESGEPTMRLAWPIPPGLPISPG